MKCIPAEGISNDDLIAAAGKELYKIGFSYCMKNKWIKKDKASGLITALVAEPKDDLQVWNSCMIINLDYPYGFEEYKRWCYKGCSW